MKEGIEDFNGLKRKIMRFCEKRDWDIAFLRWKRQVDWKATRRLFYWAVYLLIGAWIIISFYPMQRSGRLGEANVLFGTIFGTILWILAGKLVLWLVAKARRK